MYAKVVLSMLEADHEIRKLTFTNRTVGVVGRASNCYVQLPNDLLHLVVSRHHCLLDIDPPDVRVQDLGSRNGTFVNGVKIGQRPRGSFAEDTVADEEPFYHLGEGDELRVGDTVFRVGVEPGDESSPEAAAEDAEAHRANGHELCGSAH
jgi:pSer/pThr/pTyr-binding forkhead associated (FHA) protein